MINIIASVSKNWVIGKNGELPWYLPDDLRRFKKITVGHTVVMGRNTHESLKKKLYYRKSAVLPGRKNIILTRQDGYESEGCVIANSLDEVFEDSRNGYGGEIFIIGGEQLYKQTIDKADRLYLTVVDAEFDGDAFFPEVNETEWKLITKEHHDADDKHEHAFDFCVYERR